MSSSTPPSADLLQCREQEHAATRTTTASQFLRQFLQLEIPASAFDHRAHIFLAWAALQELPLARALDVISSGIQRFAEHNGAPNKFHVTVTWTYLLVINERLSTLHSLETSFEEFCASNADLFEPVETFMNAWYQESTWKSALAQTSYRLPDRSLADS